MLKAQTQVLFRILPKSGKFPLREYVHPPEGCTKFLYSVSFGTPKEKEEGDGK